MGNKFKGLAYYKGELPVDWQAKALAALAPLKAIEGANVSVSGDVLTVEIGGKGFSLGAINNATCGVIADVSSAGALVVVLLALNKALGASLEIVDDAQVPVPVMVRQAYPLFAADWQRVSAVAEALGLVTGQKIRAQYASLFNRVI